MIIIELTGGLGNQMFQYAAGKSLSIEKNTQLFVDDINLVNSSLYDSVTPRSFELDKFNLHVPFISSKLRNKFLKPTPFERVMNRLISNNYIIRTESEIGNCENSDKLSKNIYLRGYWQNEKFFLRHSELIKKDFTFNPVYDYENLKYLDLIHKKVSISIHVRRGDYLKKENINTLGICNINYYRKAIEYFEKGFNNIAYFIFTDDYDWVHEKILPLAKEMYLIRCNSKSNSWKDMYLMSECKHNIIANSSFSWWGAYLNSNVQKVVIAPNLWFANPNLKSKDIIVENWITFPNE